MKKRHRLDRVLRMEATRSSRAEASTGKHPPLHPMQRSKAALWAWYEANGKSWAQFIFDHGAP